MLSEAESKLRFWLLSGFLLLATAGCGGGNIGQVEGTITLDGKPLPDVAVNFTPLNAVDGVAPGSSGMTDSNGKYSLSMVMDEVAGAIVGQHKVVITRGFVSTSDVATPQELAKANLPFHDFKFEVKAGANTADFNIESKKGKR
jgi:hypothetical protein